MTLNPCRCNNTPERVLLRNGLVRISCVLGKCPDLICAKPALADRAWNEANPLVNDAPTLPENVVPAPDEDEPTLIEVTMGPEWSEVGR